MKVWCEHKAVLLACVSARPVLGQEMVSNVQFLLTWLEVISSGCFLLTFPPDMCQRPDSFPSLLKGMGPCKITATAKRLA